MDSEQTSPLDGLRAFYDGQGYLRIPVDDYYDKEGNLHKAGTPADPDEESREQPDSEAKHKSKAVTEIGIKISLNFETQG